jgi:transcriptional regulator with XRE-family HTH domain
MPPLATLWPWYPHETRDAAVTHRHTSVHPPPPQDTPLQRFGATLRHYRHQQGLTQPVLAARVGIRYSYISEIELGKRNITVLTLLRLARALDIPTAWLLAGLDTHADLTAPAACDALPSSGGRDAVVTHDTPPTLKPADQATLLPLLGATLRRYRQQRGLFQEALATMTNLTPTYIGEIERGKRNLSVLSLLRITDALGLSVTHLLASLETCQSTFPPLTQ